MGGFLFLKINFRKDGIPEPEGGGNDDLVVVGGVAVMVDSVLPKKEDFV